MVAQVDEAINRLRTPMLIVGAIALAVLSGAATTLFHALSEARFSLFPRAASGDVVIVAIDATSIKELGVWPWPRRFHGQAIRALGRAGASDIVFDVDFSSRSNSEDDGAFAEALSEAKGSVVLPSFVQHPRNSAAPIVSEPLAIFAKKSWRATANVLPDRGGIVRTYAAGGEVGGVVLPSIASMLAGTYTGTTNKFGIDFSIRPETIPEISFLDVISGRLPDGILAGKKVVIGATAIELGDRFTTPVGETLPGVVLQVLAAESLIQQRSLERAGGWTKAAMLAGFAALLVLLDGRVRPRLRLIMLVALSLSLEAVATYLQGAHAILLDTSLLHAGVLAAVATTAMDEIDIRGLMARLEQLRFRRIAVTLADGLVCTDSDGLITFWNPGAGQIFGLGAGDTLGAPFHELIATDDPDNRFTPESVFQSAGGETSRIVELDGVRASGERFSLEASISRWRHTAGYNYGIILRDISERKREESRIRYLAEHDSLTGLVNRAKLNDLLADAIQKARSNISEVVVMLLGLDRFKDLNDMLGQDRGDEIISAVADYLRNVVPPGAIIARVSGDEFAVCCIVRNGEAQETIADLALALPVMPLELADRAIRVTHSLGSARYPDDGRTAAELMGNAALAMQTAKTTRRGGHVAYRPEIRGRVEAARRLEKELAAAFENGEFELFYQPQVDLTTHRVIGAEALLRWNHPARGLVPPGQFLPVLDTLPLSAEVGRWVIETAIRQARVFEDQGLKLRIGINLCAAIIEHGSLPDIVAGALAATGATAELIDLEVTETIALADGNIADVLRRTKATGVSISLDDFGTGHASLTHLKRFPVDRLKIDQTFIRDMVRNREDRAIVGALVGLGRLLGLDVIAEGIEDAETAAALREIGCTEGQGYYFGRPEAVQLFTGRIRSAA